MRSVLTSFKRYTWLLLLVSCLPALWALFKPGFYGASDDVHIAWLFEMDRAVQNMQIPPRFVPDLSYGFGYPLFNFVFPLPFYLGEVFHLFGLSLVDSIKSVFFLSVPLSAISMYLLLRKFVNQAFSFAGAMVYTLTPYRSTDLYVRGAIGEIISFVLFPLIILSILNLLPEGGTKHLNFKWIGIGGLSLGALILTHDIAAFMFLPFAVLLVICEVILIKFKKEFLWGIGYMFLLGLTVGLYFWLPAILDSGLVKYDTVFNFADHFPTLGQLLIPFWGYGASVPGPYDGMSFFIGLPNLGLLFAGLGVLVVSWRKFSLSEKIILIWAIMAFSASFLMMNYRSSLIWKILPFLPYFQFPWRFLMMTTFVTPILVICLTKLKLGKFLSVGLVCLSLILAIPIFKPQDFLGRLDAYFLDRYIPWPVVTDNYSKNQEEYLRLPRSSQKRPNQNYPRVFGNVLGQVQVNEINSLDGEITTNSNQAILLNYSKYFFPGWQAYLDNQPVKIQPGQPFGQVTVLVPSGQHDLIVKFQETPLKRFLDIISLLGLLLAFWLIAKRGYNYTNAE